MDTSQQLQLPMLTWYQGPLMVDLELVSQATTYREAVRACWDLRTRKSLTKAQLATEAGLYASHVSDYVSAKATKRNLPAEHINAFEVACGNRFITQWHNQQCGLGTVPLNLRKAA